MRLPQGLLIAIGGGCMLMGAHAQALETAVKDHLGSPTIFVNGRPVAPLFLYAEPSDAATSPFREQARMATEAGIDLFSFSLPVPWPAPGEDGADVRAQIDRAFEIALAINPDMLALPRFWMMAPEWWLQSHPEHRMVFNDAAESGPQPWNSVASKPWREAMLERLAEFVAYCEEKWGDHVLGYHPCGLNTAEWFYFRSWEPVYSGFEEPMRQGFAEWAKAKYSTEDALRDAWKQPDVTFDSVRVPTGEERDAAALGMFRDPATERFVMDFAEYQQIAIVEPLELIARKVKDVTKGRKIVCFFYGYTFELSGIPKGPAQGGHLALERLLQCPDVDILCSPMSYMSRRGGGIGPLMVPVDSVRRAGKLYLLEDDTRTHLTPPGSAENTALATQSLQETQWEHRRAFGHIAPRRMAAWYMDLLSEGWLKDQAIWDNIRDLRSTYDGLMAQPATFEPEVAVVVDERSLWSLAPNNVLSGVHLSRFRDEWYRIGTGFGIYLLSDVVAGRVELPKATLFLGCFRLDDAQRQALRRALEGKTAVWFHGSGYQSDTDASAAHMAALTGFDFAETASGGSASITFLENSPLTDGLAGSTYGNDELLLAPRWSVNAGDGITPLARYTDGSIAAAARETTGGRDVYVGALGCPSKLLRNILTAAGVHVYVDTGDMFIADGTMATLTATEAGDKPIHVPAGKMLVRMDGGEVVPQEGDIAHETLARGEVRQYLLR